MDANALLLAVRVRFPLADEAERIHPGSALRVPSSVLEELDSLVERDVQGARAAAAFARTLPILRVEGRGDDAILEYAAQHDVRVLTADRALGKRLRERGVDVLAPRDRHRLELRLGTRTAGPRVEGLPRGRAPRRRQRL